jgi:hypothetical protein
MQQLNYKNGKAAFSTWSVPRCYKRRTRSIDSLRESLKRGPEPGGGGIAIVGAVIRKRLVTD